MAQQPIRDKSDQIIRRLPRIAVMDDRFRSSRLQSNLFNEKVRRQKNEGGREEG